MYTLTKPCCCVCACSDFLGCQITLDHTISATAVLRASQYDIHDHFLRGVCAQLPAMAATGKARL